MLLLALKDGTRIFHLKIEEHINQSDRLGSLHEYRRLLEVLFGFYEPMESALQEMVPASAGVLFTPPRKASLLTRDLFSVGQSQEHIQELSRCADLPQLRTPTQIFGSLYALEGVQLGGATIARHLKHRFNFDAQFGAAFFNDYCNESANIWNDLATAVTQYAATPEIEQAIVCAARECLHSFDRWLLCRQ